jgi:hypothetical protein
MGVGICRGCRRFARGESCPFCGAIVGAPLSLPPGRRTRTGRLVGSATAAAVVLAGCSGQDVYGGPPFDGGNDTGPIAADAAYGIVPFDAGDTGVKDASDASTTDAEGGAGG